jgi:hypothetical protein
MADLTFDTLMDDGNYLGTERARRENEVVLKELDRKKMARTGMAVPTDDNRVKARLREIGEPITMFGERVCIPCCAYVLCSEPLTGCRSSRPSYICPVSN